jgi:hypothetical protein
MKSLRVSGVAATGRIAILALRLSCGLRQIAPEKRAFKTSAQLRGIRVRE